MWHVAPRPELDLSGLPYEVDATDSKPPEHSTKEEEQTSTCLGKKDARQPVGGLPDESALEREPRREGCLLQPRPL